MFYLVGIKSINQHLTFEHKNTPGENSWGISKLECNKCLSRRAVERLILLHLRHEVINDLLNLVALELDFVFILYKQLIRVGFCIFRTERVTILSFHSGSSFFWMKYITW